MLKPEFEYKIELEKVIGHIKDSTTLADIRGNGVGQFIYATNDHRSIEISQSDEGIWIEFWENDIEIPVKEITVSNYKEAITVSLSWLNSQY
jgi:hypothetical protein